MSLKNIILLILIVLAATVIFAEEAGTSTSSSLTNTTTSNDNPTQSTTYTTKTTTISTTSNSIDDDIVSAVYAKYNKDPALIGTTLTVSSQNGIVTVSGTVTAQSQADEASIAAKSINGVKDVRSNIIVTTNPNLNKLPNKPNY